MRKQFDILITDEPSGRLYVRIKDMDDQKIMASQSEVPASDERLDARRNRIANFFESLRYTLQQRAFPKDTLIFDQVTTRHGVKLTNPRYPET